MYTISHAQFSMLRQQAHGAFVSRLAREHKERFAAYAATFADASALEADTAAAIAEAQSKGFLRRDDVRRYASFWVQYGPGFAERPECRWAAAPLERRDLCPTLRLDLLDVAERAALGRGNRWHVSQKSR